MSDYEFLTMGDTKTRPNNWCRQFARKVGPSENSVRYSSVYDSPLDRLAIAMERTPSARPTRDRATAQLHI